MQTIGSDIPVYNVKGLKARLSMHVKNDIWSYPEVNHWYDDLEFVLVTKGTVKFNINGVTYKIAEGQMLYIASRQMHHNVYDSNEEWAYRQLTIHPDMIFCNEALSNCSDMLCSDDAVPFLLFSKGSSRQSGVIEAVNRIFEAIFKGNEFDITSEIVRLGGVITSYLDSVPKGYGGMDKNLKIMHDMVGFIQANYREKITIADIGKGGGIGRSKCCELFKEYWNTSPNDYLNEYRLGKSIDMYSDSKRSIASIAKECGFKSQSYYAELFKKVTGRAPTDYKNSLLNPFG